MFFPAPIKGVWEQTKRLNSKNTGDRDMHENALMRYSKAVGDATELAAQAELSPTLMVSCLTRYIDVVVRCADDSDFRPNWSTGGTESTDKRAQCA